MTCFGYVFCIEFYASEAFVNELAGYCDKAERTNKVVVQVGELAEKANTIDKLYRKTTIVIKGMSFEQYNDHITVTLRFECEGKETFSSQVSVFNASELIKNSSSTVAQALNTYIKEQQGGV